MLGEPLPAGHCPSQADPCLGLLLTLRQVFSEQVTTPMNALFHYHPSHPFAVSISFFPEYQHPVTWTFSRDLLDAGTRDPSGDGDVRVRPATEGDGRRVVRILLNAPRGQAQFAADHDGLRLWLAWTYDAVPAGTESSLLDWDAIGSRLKRSL